MRRYALVQKARDSDVFGILVGTLGVGMSKHTTISFSTHIDEFLRTDSVIPPPHRPHPLHPQACTEKILHSKRRQNQSLKTGQLYGN